MLLGRGGGRLEEKIREGERLVIGHCQKTLKAITNVIKTDTYLLS